MKNKTFTTSSTPEPLPFRTVVVFQQITGGPAVALMVTAGVIILFTIWMFAASFREAFPPEGLGVILGFIIVAASLFNLGVSILLFFGGLCMKRLQSWGFSIFVAVLAVVPIPFLFLGYLIGLPVGIWALVVLKKPEVKAALLAPSPIAQRIAAPAMAMMVTAGIGIFAGIGLLAFVAYLFDLTSPFHDVAFYNLERFGIYVLIAINGFILFAGWSMKNLKNWRCCMAGAVLALLFNPLPSGLPLGIWSLTVLLKPEVKASFQEFRLRYAAYKDPAERNGSF